MPSVPRALAIGSVLLGGLLGGFLAYRGFERQPAGLPLQGSGERAERAEHGSTGGAPADSAGRDGDAAQLTPRARPIPESIPDVRLPDLAGNEKSLRDFLGHPLIVNFWATWCAPCRREMPLLQQLRRAYRGDGLEIVGVAVDFRTAVEQYRRQHAVDYPLLVGEQQGLAAVEQFGMQPVLPFSIFADAQGRIVTVKLGELHRDEADYILGMMRQLAAGGTDLARARTGISARLKELAIERAQGPAERP